jgi:pSer/pThr/pTyr-binding forkhead associated (FHA) protein
LNRPVEVEPLRETNNHTPHNPQLIVNGKHIIPLQKPIVNIGRSKDNHLVLDDLFVSRHHIQLRLRFGRYTLFDTSSQSGTKVNDVPVREHRLQSGDVIRVGKTQIVYLEDDPNNGEEGTGVNAALDPRGGD